MGTMIAITVKWNIKPEYAEDWPRLRHAGNHRRMETLVPLVDLSTDEQLTDWLTGAA